MNLYRGEICVSDSTDACLGGDATIDTSSGPQIGYLKSSGGAGTVPVYQSTCYVNSSGGTIGWGLSLDTNGSAVGYLSTTAPDGPSGSNPFIQSNEGRKRGRESFVDRRISYTIKMEAICRVALVCQPVVWRIMFSTDVSVA